MTANRIREIRHTRGLSQEALGARIGHSKATISKIENGKQPLDLETARRIAEVCDVTIQEVLAIEPLGASEKPHGFAEDASRYVAPAGDPLKGFETGNQHLMRIESPVLDKAGVAEGDIVVVNYGAQACANLKPLAPVVVRYSPTDDPTEEGVTLVRQFVPPSLLITNSSKINYRSIDIDREAVSIVGVIESTHRRHARQ